MIEITRDEAAIVLRAIAKSAHDGLPLDTWPLILRMLRAVDEAFGDAELEALVALGGLMKRHRNVAFSVIEGAEGDAAAARLRLWNAIRPSNAGRSANDNGSLR